MEIDFVGIKNNTRVYIQVAYLIDSTKTREREFNNLLRIDNNYPKYVVTMDNFGSNYKGIKHIHLREFLMMTEF